MNIGIGDIPDGMMCKNINSDNNNVIHLYFIIQKKINKIQFIYKIANIRSYTTPK